VVLDNHSIPGDAAVEIEGLYTKVGGTSSIAADLLLNQTVVFAIEEMLANNFEPPVPHECKLLTVARSSTIN